MSKSIENSENTAGTRWQTLYRSMALNEWFVHLAGRPISLRISHYFLSCFASSEF
jgi:hypothetical protein